MRPEDIARLRHMRDAASLALRFVQGRRREDLDYFDVDRDVLWSTLRDELPGLRARISEALDEHDPPAKGSGQASQP